MRILALTSEAPEKVEPFVPAKGIGYTVGIGGEHAGYGSGGIPHAYLIGADGTVVWEGHPARLNSGDVEKHLRKAKKGFFLREVSPVLKAAATAFRKGDMAEAEKLARSVAESRSDDAQAAEDARYVLGRVEKMRAFWKGLAGRNEASGDYERVFDALEALQKHFKGGEDAAWAAERENALKADPQVKLELKATKQLAKLYAQKEKAGNSGKKLDALAGRVEKFIEKYAGTKTAARAEAFLKSVRETRRR